MNIDVLIVGQGLAGSLLAIELLALGAKVFVVDDEDASAASRIAGAVLHPIHNKTGRLLPDYAKKIEAAIACYYALEHKFNQPFVQSHKMLICHPAIIPSNNSFTSLPSADEKNFLHQSFSGTDEYHLLNPVFAINSGLLLDSIKNHLKQNKAYWGCLFDAKKLKKANNTFDYEGINAKLTIFCNGAAAAQCDMFKHIPWTNNKGEVLMLKSAHINPNYIYQNHYRIKHLHEDVFWLGTSHQWDFTSPMPSVEWRKEMEKFLQGWLRQPFEVIGHFAALRPTTAGQQIFAAMHPTLPNIGIFNGFGTKGFTNIPLEAASFAQRLVSFL